MSPEKPVIFVVDDEPGNLRAMARLFGFYEVEVRCFPSAIDALREVEAKPPHAVVTDQQMPGMTGVQFLEQLSARFPEVIRVLYSGLPVRFPLPWNSLAFQKPMDAPALVDAVVALLGLTDK